MGGVTERQEKQVLMSGKAFYAWPPLEGNWKNGCHYEFVSKQAVHSILTAYLKLDDTLLQLTCSVRERNSAMRLAFALFFLISLLGRARIVARCRR